MHGMAHFVEQGEYFIMGEQRWFVARGFGEIADNRNHRTFDLTAIKTLFAITGHPCALFLTRAWIEIGIERANEFPGGIFGHIIRNHIGVPDRIIRRGSEFETEEFAEMFEGAIEDAVKWKITGADLRLRTGISAVAVFHCNSPHPMVLDHQYHRLLRLL